MRVLSAETKFCVSPRQVMLCSRPGRNAVVIEHLAAVVAIPVKNEAERVVACLEALAAQRDHRNRPIPADTYGVVLVLNNCTDATAQVVDGVGERLPYPLWVVERELAPARAHAGWARKLAMDAAADLLGRANGAHPRLILTTDADGRVGSRWLDANLTAARAGADLVAGFVRADRVEHARLPITVIERGQLESRYEWLLSELSARLDPELHDPWPRHRMASGASLGVTLAAYRRIGGLPPIPTGEDRALAARIAATGGHIRHSLSAQVVVSCRLDGRAEGGMAATIRQRALKPELACDPALESAVDLVRRARWRAELRRRHRDGLLRSCTAWSSKLELGQAEAAATAELSHFGAVWASIERSSPILVYRPLAPSQLAAQIATAKSLLAELCDGRGLPKPLQDVNAVELGPVLMHDPRRPGRRRDEPLRSLVAGQGIVGPAGPMHQDDVAAGLDGAFGERGHALEIADAPVVDNLG